MRNAPHYNGSNTPCEEVDMTTNRTLLGWTAPDAIPVFLGLLLLGYILQSGPGATVHDTMLVILSLVLAAAFAALFVATHLAHGPLQRTWFILLIATLVVFLAGLTAHEIKVAILQQPTV
jgi:membrane-bound acyltransferase YfiQ involved in biofilm formation